MRNLIAGLVVAAGLLGAAPALAAPIVYTYAGNGTGTVGGVGFTNQAYSIQLQAESTAATDGNHDNAISAGIITIAGTACSAGCTFTSPALYRFTTNYSGNTITGIEGAAGGSPIVNESLFGASYDLTVATATVVAAATNGSAPYAVVATSGGAVQITTNTTNPSFTAALGSLGPTPVPTMTEWAMILFGTILAGGAALMIQRRRFML